MRLVSVIVPAYNAAETINETLVSVRSQTHRHLDIIVVDDGSTDGTVAIAEHHARTDDRVRLLRQSNQGVAAARNTAIHVARGDLVAPIDADDLWAPDKIERQVGVFEQHGPEVALVYTLHAVIDRAGHITGFGHQPDPSRVGLRAMCHRNLVGNGSAAMMRTADVIALGGYDPTLRARRAQGCEDYKLYLALAAQGRIVAVPDFLTGYRHTPTNMSSDVLQMERSHQIVFDELAAAHPELHADIRIGRRVCVRWLLIRAVAARDWRSSGMLFRSLLAQDAAGAAAVAGDLPVRLMRRFGRRAWRSLTSDKRDVAPAVHFLTGPVEM